MTCESYLTLRNGLASVGLEESSHNSKLSYNELARVRFKPNGVIFPGLPAALVFLTMATTHMDGYGTENL